MNSGTIALQQSAEEPKRHSFLVELLIRLVKEKPLGTVGAVIVLVIFLVGILANYLAPYPMSEMNLATRLLPPSETAEKVRFPFEKGGFKGDY